MFLNEIYYLFPIYHLHNTGLLEIFGDQTQGTYEYFIQECKEHYYSDKFDKTIQSLFHKNFLTDKELIQLFFDTCRNSYREIYEFASKMSQEDYKKFIHNHGMDSCFDWMGGFENLERFFFNAILAQYIKIFTSCHVN